MNWFSNKVQLGSHCPTDQLKKKSNIIARLNFSGAEFSSVICCIHLKSLKWGILKEILLCFGQHCERFYKVSLIKHEIALRAQRRKH